MLKISAFFLSSFVSFIPYLPSFLPSLIYSLLPSFHSFFFYLLTSPSFPSFLPPFFPLLCFLSPFLPSSPHLASPLTFSRLRTCGRRLVPSVTWCRSAFPPRRSHRRREVLLLLSSRTMMLWTRPAVSTVKLCEGSLVLWGYFLNFYICS